jgi:hypothetical protein
VNLLFNGTIFCNGGRRDSISRSGTGVELGSAILQEQDSVSKFPNLSKIGDAQNPHHSFFDPVPSSALDLAMKS